MLKEVIRYVIILILTFSSCVILLRLIYLHFKPRILEKMKFIVNGPEKSELSLYYILALGAAIYIIYIKISS